MMTMAVNKKKNSRDWQLTK